MATKKGSAGKKAVALGAIAAAAAGAAAGYYFYASKNAKQNRRIAAKWATNLKNDVVKQAKKLQDIDKAQLAAIIDDAAQAYESVKNVDRKDVARAVKELKSNWQELAGELAGGKKKAVKPAAKKGARTTTTKKKAAPKK